MNRTLLTWAAAGLGALLFGFAVAELCFRQFAAGGVALAYALVLIVVAVLLAAEHNVREQQMMSGMPGLGSR
jgi:uncharacterized membrane protein YidH (DUF202 family)